MSPKVYLNGTLVAFDEAAVPISSPSLLHGVGLFAQVVGRKTQHAGRRVDRADPGGRD